MEKRLYGQTSGDCLFVVYAKLLCGQGRKHPNAAQVLSSVVPVASQALALMRQVGHLYSDSLNGYGDFFL